MVAEAQVIAMTLQRRIAERPIELDSGEPRLLLRFAQANRVGHERVVVEQGAQDAEGFSGSQHARAGFFAELREAGRDALFEAVGILVQLPAQDARLGF